MSHPTIQEPTIEERINALTNGDVQGKIFYELKEIEREVYERLSDVQDELNELYRLQDLLRDKNSSSELLKENNKCAK